jgi:predicted porin
MALVLHPMLNAQSFTDFQQREFAGKRRSTPHFNNQGELQMQKKIIALAIAAAFAAPAAAMADATVYGVLDGGFRSVTTNGSTANTMGSGLLNSNRFGIKASEDLGDGMKANVVLEGDITTGTGQDVPANGQANNLFSRQTTVGLSSDMGAIDMGHQFTTAFKVNTVIDPFEHHFIGITTANKASGINSAGAITRNDNDVAYTGKFGGLTVFADRSIGGSSTSATPATAPTTTDAGSTTAVGATYVQGPIIAAASYSKVKSNNTNTALSSDMTHYQLGAGFNFGAGKVMVGYADQKNADQSAIGVRLVGSDVETKNIWIGASFNVSDKVGVTAAHYRTTTSVTGGNDVVATNTVAAVTYALSKKTALYVEADKQTSDVANASDTNGYAAGLSVAF